MPTTITGTDGVSQVQTGSIQSDDLAAGAITIGSGDLPAGSVIQVVTSVTTNRTITTSTNYVSTGLSASITPISSSSTILIMTGQSGDNSGNNSRAVVSLFRDGTDLSSGGFGFQVIGQDVRTQAPANIVFSDTPNTTSSVTYDTRVRSSSGTQVEISLASDMPFTITLMEVAG